MTGRTHVAVGIATGLLIAKQFNIQLDSQNTSSMAMYIAALTAGSLLPDIDHAGSSVGRKIPILPHLLKHRGITHTLLAVMATYIILLPFNAPHLIVLGFVIGYICHLLGDLLTPAGLNIFYPFKIHVALPIIQNKVIDQAVMLLCIMFTGTLIL